MENISKHSVLISALLIFFGALRLYFFYSEFDICIFSYLTISEIVVSFFDNIIEFVWFVFISFIQTFVAYGFLLLPKKEITIKLKEGVNKYINTHVDRRFLKLLIISVLIFISMNYGILFCYNKLSIYILTFFVSQTASYLVDVINLGVEKNKIEKPSEIIFTLTAGLFVLTYCFATKEVKDLRMNLFETQINTQNERINCSKDSKIMFLGKTENFVFLFNDSSKTSIIYPIGEVKRIEQTKK